MGGCNSKDSQVIQEPPPKKYTPKPAPPPPTQQELEIKRRKEELQKQWEEEARRVGPPSPEKPPAKFEGKSPEDYKEYMRIRYEYEQWENGVIVLARKMQRESAAQGIVEPPSSKSEVIQSKPIDSPRPVDPPVSKSVDPPISKSVDPPISKPVNPPIQSRTPNSTQSKPVSPPNQSRTPNSTQSKQTVQSKGESFRPPTPPEPSVISLNEIDLESDDLVEQMIQIVPAPEEDFPQEPPPPYPSSTHMEKRLSENAILAIEELKELLDNGLITDADFESRSKEASNLP